MYLELLKTRPGVQRQRRSIASLRIMDRHHMLQMHILATRNSRVGDSPSMVRHGSGRCWVHHGRRSLLLRAVVFAPDVEHEDGGDEEQRHDQHRHRSHLDAGRVVCVETPHASRSGSAGGSRLCGAVATSGGLALLQAASGPGRSWRRQFTG